MAMGLHGGRKEGCSTVLHPSLLLVMTKHIAFWDGGFLCWTR
jgi:hypothetical protein